MAQHAVNMLHGEVYGYAHYLQLNHFIPKNVKFMWYDVICKYWPWLCKNDIEASTKMKPALSVMHAKAHAWYCQVSSILFINTMFHCYYYIIVFIINDNDHLLNYNCFIKKNHKDLLSIESM